MIINLQDRPPCTDSRTDLEVVNGNTRRIGRHVKKHLPVRYSRTAISMDRIELHGPGWNSMERL